MTTVARPRSLRLAALAGLTAAALLALGAVARPAAAHDGDAVLVVEAVHPAGQSIHYIVRVTWESDGHPAADATVTATGVAPDGSQLTPVALAPADQDGRYAGAIEYPAPGAWTVRITSIDPTGTVEQAQEVTATPATQAPDVTTGTGDAEGFAPEEDGTGASAGGEQAADDAGDDSGMPVAVIVVAGLVVILGAVTAVGIIRRTRANPPVGAAGPDPDGSTHGAPPDPDGSTPEAAVPPASATSTPAAGPTGGDDPTPE